MICESFAIFSAVFGTPAPAHAGVQALRAGAGVQVGSFLVGESELMADFIAPPSVAIQNIGLQDQGAHSFAGGGDIEGFQLAAEPPGRRPGLAAAR